MAKTRASKPRKSRAKGRTAAEQFATAQRRIEAAKRAGRTELDLSELPKLAALPPEIASLTALQSLDLMRTPVSDLAPLAGLTALQSLDVAHTQVSDLAPLASLTALQSLYFWDTQVSDLAPLAGLTALQSLDLGSTPVSNLAPLAGLTALQSLDLGGTEVSDIAPLAGLTVLQRLDLGGTPVSDLAPLAGLTVLQRLDLGGAQVSDITPLASLTALQSLDLGGAQVSDIAPLAGLTALQSLGLMGTQVSDLAPLAGLTALQSLYLIRTQVSDIAPLAGLTDLKRLDLTGTRVSDIAPLAGLTDLQSLDLMRTEVSDLAPLAGLTALQSLDLTGTWVSDLAPLADMREMLDAITSNNAIRRHLVDGLSYGGTPVAQISPFNRLVRLEESARTVETINEVRRRRGLPEHIPEGYEQAADLDELLRDDRPERPLRDSLLQPPSQPLPGPSPATRFTVVGGRVDIVTPSAWKDRNERAAIYHSRARKLATDLGDRLLRTDAVPDVAASVAALTDVLGQDIESVQPDQLRLAARSIAAKARAYGHPGAQWEIGAESVSAIFELADLLVDLQGFAKTDIEANEQAIRQLELNPGLAAAAKIALDEITEAIETIPEIVTERVESTFANAALLSGSSIDADVKVAVEGERILLTENLALSVARSVGGSGGGEPPDDEGPQPEKPERSKRRPRKPTAPGKELTWEDFRERLLGRLQKKAPEAIADAALQAVVSTIKHAPKTIAGLGAAIVLWSASYPLVIGGSLALTVAWIRYELAKRHRSKN